MPENTGDDVDETNTGDGAGADAERSSALEIAADRRTALKGLGGAGISLGLGALASGSAAASQPADKVAVSGSTLEVMEVSATDSENHSATHTLLSDTIKTSTPTDLLLQPTVETALFTDIMTMGNDQSEAEASVTCWIELDDEPVVVSSDYTAAGLSEQAASEVVFDKRAHRMETANFDDEEATIRQFLDTRSANGFNWVTLDVGNGEHELELKGRLDVNVDDSNAEARAIVGPRTMIVEPVKLPNDAEI